MSPYFSFGHFRLDYQGIVKACCRLVLSSLQAKHTNVQDPYIFLLGPKSYYLLLDYVYRLHCVIATSFSSDKKSRHLWTSPTRALYRFRVLEKFRKIPHTQKLAKTVFSPVKTASSFYLSVLG